MNKELIENNKLIAEFMGAFHEEPQPKHVVSVELGDDVWFLDLTDDDSGKFHTSWDWLMPVVEKILNLKETYPQERQKVFEKISPDRSITYQAVVEFINWYNQQKINK